MEALKNNSQAIVRALTVAVAVVLQAITMVLVGRYLHEYASWAYVLLEIISFLLVFGLINDQESYRQFWCVIVLVFPVTGLFLYYMWGQRRRNSKTHILIRETEAKMRQYVPHQPEVMEELQELHPYKVQIARFLGSEGFNMYRHTDVKYFPLGEEMLDAMIEDLKKAEKCIFLEYFIISDGVIWKRVKEVLIEKAKAGIDIRLLIDDFGCLGINTAEFRDELVKSGIRLAVFAPIHKNVDRLSFNYRNHQKITIVDGNIGYCGGINLADEYANIIQRFGHWKDTAVKLEGEAVRSFTVMFLQMWYMTEAGEGEYEKYLPHFEAPSTSGYVIPYNDDPINRLDIAESVYLDMLYKAKKYVHIMTPYLIIDNELITALTYAARRGVDVKLILPHIPDKKIIFAIARTYYPQLLEAGVKIYEYTPGFVHAKEFVSDDKKAVVGSINLDFRSLYEHFECATFIYKNPVILDIEKDYQETLKKCQKIDMQFCVDLPLWYRIGGHIFRLFGPLV